MEFTVSITDPAKLAGITAARVAYNAALPEGAIAFANDEEYVQFVMDKAAESYANHFNT